MKKPLQYLSSGGEETTLEAILKATHNPKCLSSRGKGPTPTAIFKGDKPEETVRRHYPKGSMCHKLPERNPKSGNVSPITTRSH